MNPSQRSFQLKSINKLLEGSATVVDIQLPTGAQKTRGRPKSSQGKKIVGKKIKTERRDPSEFEILAKKRRAEEKEAEEIQKKTRIQPSRIQPSRKSAPQFENKKPEEVPQKIFWPVRTASKKNPLPEANLSYYLSQLPINIQPHVKKILNPRADGHCGFRAVSFLLHQDENQWPRIRRELTHQINCRSEFYSENMLVPDVPNALKRINFEDEDESCGQENWMSMPSTGYVLADLYQRLVFFFSATWSETILPSSCPPNNNPPLFLTLVGNHYMILQLKNPSLFPAPQLMRNWDSYSSPEALAWKDRYSACIEMTQEIKKKTRNSRITY